ncbi:MAG: hypothetical protein RL537_21, partial [Actinomycetota bacterium]
MADWPRHRWHAVHDDGFLSHAVVEQVQRVRSLGHEVFIATGRAAGNAYPVI